METSNEKPDKRKQNKGVKGRAGRKKILQSEKAVQVAFYLPGNIIKCVNGLENAKEIAKKAIMIKSKNKSKNDLVIK